MLSRWQLERIASTLSSGGVIAYPTESVFGLGCDPRNEKALLRLLQLKNRPAEKGLIILVSDLEQAKPFIQPLSVKEQQIINKPQSRATTWLVKRRSEVSPLLCGNSDRLAVRVTQHPIAKAICDYRDLPLVSTSCNKTGKPELVNLLAVRNHWQFQLDYIVSGQCGGQKPSRIIDLSSHRVLRD